MLGGYNLEIARRAPIIKVPLLYPNILFIEVSQVLLGKSVVTTKNTPAFIDLANTYISFPLGMIKEFKIAFSEKMMQCRLLQQTHPAYFRLGCQMSQLDDLPNLRFFFGEGEIMIEFDRLIHRCTKGFLGLGRYDCIFKIEFQQNGTEIVLGKAFLSETYTGVFYDKKQIWFSQPNSVRRKRKKMRTTHKEALEALLLIGPL